MRFSTLSEWLSWQEKLHPAAIDLGLDRIKRTLSRLDWRAPSCPVITVGGTNGKGSTVAMLRRILTAAGYRVGTFTSPHLIRYNERITIGEQEVSDASLVATFERIDAARGAETLTFFEFNTLAALLVFETAHVDAMVLEVGLGGRLDAVNVVDADVAIITSIALDHCDWLGNDVEAIGAEKAGIMRQGRAAIFGARDMPRSIEIAARDRGSVLQRLGLAFDSHRRTDSWDWSSSKTRMEDLPLPALQGAIQLDNAAAVLAALEALAPRLPVTRDAIDKGLSTVRLGGRFQVLEFQDAQWILDVAHNPAAAQTLGQRLSELDRRQPTIAICGVLGDKDLDGILAPLRDCFDQWIAVGLPGPRATPFDQFAEQLRAAGLYVSAACPDVRTGCARASELVGVRGRVVVFGSFMTVGPALEWLQARCVTLR
jgi:dihydrofolate synthase / folylpolyglutamate synthase